MTALEILKAGRKLIEVPERWTQGDYAKDVSGKGLDAYEDEAVCWCSSGAIYKVTANGDVRFTYNDEIREAKEALAAAVGVDYFFRFNDTHTHAEVLAAWDRAIASLEAA